MSAGIELKDGKGTRRRVGVTEDNALLVATRDRKVAEISNIELTRKKLFSEFFRRESDNSRDMTVNGSVTPQYFILKASTTTVRRVSRIRILIEGTNFDLNTSGDFKRWGSIAASPGLTNGVELYVTQGGIITKIFYDNVKVLGDLFYYSTKYNNFVNAVTAQADFLSIDIEFTTEVVLPVGVVDQFTAVINDNLVDANFLTFRILAFGTQEVL